MDIVEDVADAAALLLDDDANAVITTIKMKGLSSPRSIRTRRALRLAPTPPRSSTRLLIGQRPTRQQTVVQAAS
jgi:hypothetical protein